MVDPSQLSEVLQLGRAVYVLAITLLVFSWTTVALRLWVRLRITKAPGWDDVTIIIALMLFTCYCAFILTIVTGAAGGVTTLAKLRQSLVFIRLSEVFYILTTTFLKISLGLFFLRLLTKPWQRRLFFAILGVSVTYGLYYFLETVFHCGNPTKLSDDLLGSTTCAPSWLALSSGYIYGLTNILADWTFTLIPISILIDSDLDRRSKISVGVVMGFAAVGSVSSILRMVHLKGLMFRGSISAESVRATIWATAEPGTGIIAASAAILRPLFRQVTTGIREKMTEYGTTKSSRFTMDNSVHKTTDATKRNSESEMVLTPVAAKGAFAPNNTPHYSMHAEDPWHERLSLENAQVGVGRMISIKVALGDDVRPIPPPKDWPRRS